MGHIAYIDLLGVSTLAIQDDIGYQSGLEKFREYMSSNCHILNGNGKAYMFSDCAYLESNDLIKLTEFLKTVRGQLLIDGFFLRGALAEGILDADEAISEKRYSKEVYEKRRKVLSGYTFGKSVLNVYTLESSLKGVGIWCNSENNNWLKNNCVYSCHIPQMNSRHAECFHDMKYDEKYIFGKDVINRVINSFFRSNIQSKKLGRYYIPLLITIIQCINYSNVKSDKETPTKSLLELIISGELQKLFNNVVGIEYVYYAALNKVYNECCDIDIQNRLTNYFTKNKMEKYLPAIPPEIFLPQNKKKYLDSIAPKKLF